MSSQLYRQSSTENEGLLSYPKSKASVASDSPVVRSRTWSEDITRTWNVPITGLESWADRSKRYILYFTLTHDQMRAIYEKFLLEMRLGLELHKANPRGVWESRKCSLKMIDTWVTEGMIPRGVERGATLSLDLGGMDVASVRASRVTLQGAGKISTEDVYLSLRDATLEFPKGLLDRSATASMLFDSLAGVVKQIGDQTGLTGAKPNAEASAAEPIPVGFTVCHPLEQRDLDSASLIHWTKGCETGRNSNDPVEGMDVAALLDCAFWRAELNARTAAILNDSTAAMLACAYEKPSKLPPCRVGFVLGSGVNGCYIKPDAQQSYNYHGCVINCEVACFDKSLPVNDVDLEVDFADETTKGVQLFEKMVSTAYLGELCRRLVVKVWQNDAPQLAWVRYSMPWLACARVIADESGDLSEAAQILEGLWEWRTTLLERQTVQKLFDVVFDRSAALAAVAIVALASQTERLQPAMGGLTCAVVGPLYCRIPKYADKLKDYLRVVLGPDTAELIHIWTIADSSVKGAGILATLGSPLNRSVTPAILNNN